MRSVLVVGSESLGSDRLADLIRERVLDGDCTFTLLVPATITTSTGMGMLSAVVNIPATAHNEDEYDVARKRLSFGVKWFHDLGASVDGDVGDSDPLQAIQEMLSHRQFDEIILSTMPSGVSRWLHQDLPHKIERKFHLPVTVATAEKRASG